MEEKNWRKKLYPDYKKKKPKKPKIHPDDVAPEDKYKEMDKEAQKELDKIEAEETARTPIGGWNPLMIKRDTTTQQGINRDTKKNQTGDQILDPEGNFKKGVYRNIMGNICCCKKKKEFDNNPLLKNTLYCGYCEQNFPFNE